MASTDLPVDEFHAGYAWDREDRDALYADAVEIPQAFRSFARPEEIDPRPWHKIENQGPVGSCQGHSISSCVERLWWFGSGGEVEQFSRGFAYLRTQEIDGLIGRDQGSTISGGVKAAQEGIPLESTMPYVGNYAQLVQRFKSLNEEVLRDREQFGVKSKLLIRSHVDALDFVGGGGAISLGIRWPITLDSSATCRSFGGGGRGGHAIAILGYKANGDLIVANSHTTRYGDNGWFYVTKTAFEQMLRSQYTACIGVSDMPAAQPRKIDWIKESPHV